MHAEGVPARQCNWLDKGAAADGAPKLTPEYAFLYLPHVRRIGAEALARVHPLLDGAVDAGVYRRVRAAPGRCLGGDTGRQLLFRGRFVGDCLRHVLFQRLVESARLLRSFRVATGALQL